MSSRDAGLPGRETTAGTIELATAFGPFFAMGGEYHASREASRLALSDDALALVFNRRHQQYFAVTRLAKVAFHPGHLVGVI